MIALVAVALTTSARGDCVGADQCACEEDRARAAGRVLQELSPGFGRSSEPAWRAAADATCAWAERVAGGVEACVPTTACVRLTTESRLQALSTGSPAALGAELARVTGRVGCAPGSGCASQARVAEDRRLRVVVDALDQRGLDAHEPQRYWLAYRDLACEAVAQGAPDAAWARDACAAVMAHRRTEELVALVDAAAPTDADAVARARLRQADRDAGGTRIWVRWLDRVGGGAEVQELVREALEARADRALFPPLLPAIAATRCAEPGTDACLAEVAARTRAQRDAVAPPLGDERVERTWRRRWCRGEPATCQAAVDLVVSEAARSTARSGG